jgi:hypothetical protein
VNDVRATLVRGRRILGGPSAPVRFAYVKPGLYESENLGDPEGEPFVYRLERLGRNAFEGLDETGWYLTGGDFLREWCEADVFAAVHEANVHIIASAGPPLVTHYTVRYGGHARQEPATRSKPMSDPDARPLPEPIKPRALQRRKNPVYGYDYSTSDGRYEVYPLYRDRTNGGRTNKVDSWVIKDLQDPEWTRYYPLLDDIRRYYCAPGGKVPWLVCDMDEGVLRVEPSMRAAAKWATYFNDGLFIVRADRAHYQGYNPVQQPLYPYPDDPFEKVDRPTSEEAA